MEHALRLIAGVDGCRGGWVAIFKDLDSGLISWDVFETTGNLLARRPRPQTIAIDIPIGLTDQGPRTCDLEARKLLGPGRASSVFPAPIRPVLDANDYDEARRIRYRIEQKKVSYQLWNITSRIREIDDALREDLELRNRLHEVHPEICFFVLAGSSRLRYRNKDPLGHTERYALLEPFFGHWLSDALDARLRLSSAKDDMLDAFVALWSAERIMNGTSYTIPSQAPRDSVGLPMQIAA